MSSFSVISFDGETLLRVINAFRKQLPSPLPELTEQKWHIIYFSEYLEEIKTKTIVAEHRYIDRDYLEDFAGHYVRAFREYNRFCMRLHFFSSELTAESFSAALLIMLKRIS